MDADVGQREQRQHHIGHPRGQRLDHPAARHVGRAGHLLEIAQPVLSLLLRLHRLVLIVAFLGGAMRLLELVDAALHPLGELALVQPRRHRHGQADQHTRDRRMHARFEHPAPQHHRQHHIGHRRYPAEPPQSDDPAQRARRDHQPAPVDRFGIGKGDHQQPADIVHRGKGQHQRADAGRQPVGKQRDQRQPERGVHRHHRPPAHRLRPASGNGQEQQHGHDHTADRARQRKRRGPPPRQGTADDLALHVRTDDDEEQRQQGVVDPLGQRMRHAAPAKGQREIGVPEILERAGKGGVGTDQRDQRRHRQRPARHLVPSKERPDLVQERRRRR